MKKMICLAIMLIAIVAGTSTLNALPTATPVATYETASLNDPLYWSGRAYNGTSLWLDIEVYQSPGACNSFYAVVKDGNSRDNARGRTLVVRYDSDKGKYYVTWSGNNYFFKM